MIELRYVVRDGLSVLQYRQMLNFVRNSTNHETEWGSWKDVPIVKEDAQT